MKSRSKSKEKFPSTIKGFKSEEREFDGKLQPSKTSRGIKF